MKITILEDEVLNALYIKEVVQRMGYEVEAMFHDGHKLLERAHELESKLFLLDIRLREPSLTGIDIARHLQKNSDVICIFLTAYSDKETIAQALGTNPNGYVTKPFEQRDLHIAIQSTIQKNRYARQLKSKNKQLKALFRKLNESREQERIRIARELHDDVGQDVIAMKMHLFGLMNDLEAEGFSVNPFEPFMETLDQLIDKMDSISTGLHPKALQQFGLNYSVENMIERMNKLLTNGTSIIYESGDADLSDLNENECLVIFRIIQESLNNAIKHADAKTITIQLKRNDEVITAAVSDNGIGFNYKKTIQNAEGLGLISLQERAESINGTLDIKSRSQIGTEVIFTKETGRR